MKNPAKNMNPALLLMICLIIVAGISKGLVWTGEKWGKNDIALAVELPPLMGEVNQLQLTEWLNDGYLALSE